MQDYKTTAAPVKCTHGGARAGAGRKPSPVKRQPVYFRFTDDTVRELHRLRDRHGLQMNEKVEAFIHKLAYAFGERLENPE